MKTRILLAIVCLFASFQMVKAQEHVYNIRATQQDKIVKIYYDLKTRAEVKMLISLDDGQTYTDTMTISGHVNKIMTAGRNRMITWQAFKDLGYNTGDMKVSEYLSYRTFAIPLYVGMTKEEQDYVIDALK